MDLGYFRQKSGHQRPDWATPFASPDEAGTPCDRLHPAAGESPDHQPASRSG